MKPLLVTSGEPAGIGPDICVALADSLEPIVVLGDPDLLAVRAKQLNKPILIETYDATQPLTPKRGCLTVLPCSLMTPVVPGILDERNARYVLDMLSLAAARVSEHAFSALVTAPVNKAIINQAGYGFTGHTEFFADYYHVSNVVMMLACPVMRVALLTTHLPLRHVADAITAPLIEKTVTIVDRALREYFAIEHPTIYLAGLNPHAGENGFLGREEIDHMMPAVAALRAQGIDISGPMSADTLFTQDKQHSDLNGKRACDVIVAAYHDQALPVLKYAGFGQAVNITLGLPIIRTSVDHGTALELAGSGQANPSSLLEAVHAAQAMVRARSHYEN